MYLETEHGCTLLFEGTIPYQKYVVRCALQLYYCSYQTSECEADDRARWRSVEHMQGV